MDQNILKDAFQRITKLPWKGMVSEVGFGVPIAQSWLASAGASKTLLYADSPYSKLLQPQVERSVSKEGANALLNRLQDMIPEEEKQKPIFLLAVTGSHKQEDEEGDNHGWLGLRTLIPRENHVDEVNTFIHFRILKKILGQDTNKYSSGLYTRDLAYWLMKTMLLGDYESWNHALKHIPYPDIIRIDMIDDPRMTLEDHLSLASYLNPLIYHNGSFQRVTEYLRKYDRFMSGSFNPPHQGHLEMGRDAIFVMNFENARKESISEVEMAHRVRMLDSLNVPVLIMRERPFTALQAHIIQVLGGKELTFITGVDTFNAICNPKFIPASDKVFEGLTDEQETKAREEILDQFLIPLYEDKGVTFEVFVREGYEIVDNRWSQKMKVITKEHPHLNLSSTQAREGDYSHLPESVINYIQEHNLYKN